MGDDAGDGGGGGGGAGGGGAGGGGGGCADDDGDGDERGVSSSAMYTGYIAATDNTWSCDTGGSD